VSQQLQRELDKLRRRVLFLAATVEDEIQRAVLSLERGDEALAEKVIEDDQRVDEMEVELEEECLKVLALHQPVAADLRFIVALLKINNDIERVGDLAVNISKRALFLMRHERIEIPSGLFEMSEKSRTMLRLSLDAFVNRDADLARRVCALDDEVDAIRGRLREGIEAEMKEHPERIGSYMRLDGILRHLERLADHATNIAEDVIYMTTGEVIRHRLGTARQD